MTDQPLEKDIFRDTKLRFLGYANELAEAFRPVIHKYVVLAGYGVATVYMLADVTHKSYKCYTEDQKKGYLGTAVDAGLWQFMASLVIPSITINRISASTRYCARKLTKLSDIRVKTLSVFVGLCTIPLIVKPIDHGVDFIMDQYIRDYIGTEKKKS